MPSIEETVRGAIHTPERAVWLDPEDLDGIVADVTAAVGQVRAAAWDEGYRARRHILPQYDEPNPYR